MAITRYIRSSCNVPQMGGQTLSYQLETEGDGDWTLKVFQMQGNLFWKGAYAAPATSTALEAAEGVYDRTGGISSKAYWAIDFACPESSSHSSVSSASSNSSSKSSASSPSSFSSASSNSSSSSSGAEVYVGAPQPGCGGTFKTRYRVSGTIYGCAFDVVVEWAGTYWRSDWFGSACLDAITSPPTTNDWYLMFLTLVTPDIEDTCYWNITIGTELYFPDPASATKVFGGTPVGSYTGTNLSASVTEV